MAKQAKVKNKTSTQVVSHLRQHLIEGGFILLAAIAVFLLLSLVTYHNTDAGWSNTGTLSATQNAGGKLGAWFADLFLYLFGYVGYLFPIGLVYGGWIVFRHRREMLDDSPRQRWLIALRIAGFLLLLISATGLFSLHIDPRPDYLPYSAGGIIGTLVGPGLVKLLSPVGTSLILFAILLCSFTFTTGISWFLVMDKIGQLVLWLTTTLKQQFNQAIRYVQQRWQQRQQRTPVPEAIRQTAPLISMPKKASVPKNEARIQLDKPLIITPKPKDKKPQQERLFESPEFESLPALSLLEQAKESTDAAFSKEALETLSRLVETKLKEFGIDAQVVAVYPGPVVTRFELDLAAGTKASRLTNLSRDLARSLSVLSVRIVEVIPGKTYVGLEIPNENREIVRLAEVLESSIYEKATSHLSLALGKDIAGQPVVVDLGKMPHLLVAGTTGSGKSVGVNAMLLSLLYKGTPDQVRLIMVDPKMLELSVYDDIPHLLTPVITDMKEAANALRWCIGEMDRRYRLMAALGVRNLDGYNKKVKQSLADKQPIADPTWPTAAEGEAPTLEALPSIVVVIDEFADMMMVVGKKVEELIARLAQKARAAGIHLILATQRPSVDVITGLIKANIPSRIAFQVSSRIDSRTILDQQGAEQLLGHGDMLYMAAGKEPIRVHGAFVADQEVHNVVEDLKSRGQPSYLEDILQGNKNISENGTPVSSDDNDGLDPLFDEAVKIVAETRRASISNVQRRLKIGYNRAARILEEMEAQGMVTPMESNGSREILLPQASD